MLEIRVVNLDEFALKKFLATHNNFFQVPLYLYLIVEKDGDFFQLIFACLCVISKDRK